MAGWLIPALKAMLPHVGDIISAAKPVLTKKRDVGPAQPVLRHPGHNDVVPSLVEPLAELAKLTRRVGESVNEHDGARRSMTGSFTRGIIVVDEGASAWS